MADHLLQPSSLELLLNNTLQQRFLSSSDDDACTIPARYVEILDSFSALLAVEDFSLTQKKRVLDTVLACAVLELELDRISSLHSETDRIKFITRACGINAEPGTCEGNRPETVRSVLESRLSTLCNAFHVCKRDGNLASFFQDAFRGDPCLNGRLAAIQRFAFEQETGLSADLLLQQDACTDHDDIAFKFTELMYGLSFDNPPDKVDFERYLRDQSDYERIYKPWVESPSFAQLYARAAELFA